MNLIRFSLALLLLQAPTTQNRASISGFVVKVGTNEPLSKATVVLNSADGGRNSSYSATTAAGGQFTLDNIEPGKYRLSASRNGYVRYEYGSRGPNRPGIPVTIAAGQKMPQVVLPLSPAGTITGRVFDRDGEPLANVSVQALKYSYADGERVLNTVQLAQTNDLGEYRLFWLNPGQYFIGATYAPRQNGGRQFAFGARGRGGNAAPPAQNDEGYIPVYYPGTTDPQSAGPVSLQAGSVFSGVDLTIAAVRTGRVRVQIVDGATGQPATRGTQVVLVSRQRSGMAGGNVNGRGGNDVGQGVFELTDVVPGSYDVVAFLNDRNNRRTGRTSVDVGSSETQNVTLALTSGFTLPGRLTIEGASNNSNMRVVLRPGMRMMGGGPQPSAVQADGTFTLQQVGQDTYNVTVMGMPRNAYIKTARVGATDVLNEGLRLDRQPTGPLDIVISTTTGVIDATVTNERQEPSINVTVVLVPDPAHRRRADFYKSGSTDTAGRLHLEGIPPGDYKAFAWEDVESGAWQDPDFIRQYEERGKPLHIDGTSQANLDLRVIAP